MEEKNTYHLLKSIEEILINENFETEIINLYKEKLEFCTGCEIYILKDNCFINDKCNEIMKKVIECDRLIIRIPIYLNNMSGVLKNFFDRTCS